MPTAILVCDDDALFRAALCRAFARKGHMTWSAERAEQAREVFVRERPEYVVLDMHMPCTNGFRVLAELRDAAHETRVVLLTGSLDAAVQRAALRLGAHGCLAKPTDAEEILACLSAPRICVATRTGASMSCEPPPSDARS